MIVWNMAGESVVCVHAIVASSKEGWHGQLFGIDAPTATAVDFKSARVDLASQVWKLIQGGEVSVPMTAIEKVRVYAHTVFDFPRKGDFSGAPVTVQAVADLTPEGWMAGTDSPYAGLGECLGKGGTFAEARDTLADNLLMALEVGVEAVPDDWSGLKLVMKTRKSYEVASL
ncbi:hypothetical protein [Allosalinactinospora lopnorensis]|uniref:hypothetical protein n=1 Tax=Allosalinactinospora lopnorensis TaxID=1352348 RepID=UPI000623CEFF|nr:hypothetical protein [Allosalinactinospora lopnorensis]